MIAGCFCALILGGADLSPIDSAIFGDRDPSTEAIHCVDRVAYMGLRDFSGALTRGELADDLAHLPIGDAQRQILIDCAKETYSTYLVEHDDVVLHKGNKYLAIASSLANQYQTAGLTPTADQIRERSHAADALERGLIAAERNFIQSLQECFDRAMADAGTLDAGKDSIGGIVLESLYLRADRRYTQTFFRVPQRGTDLDLRSIVDRLHVDMPTRKAVEMDVLEYERSWTALKLALAKAVWGGALRTRMLIDQCRAGQMNSATLASQSKKIGTANADIGRRIRALALEAAGRIESKLPANQQAAFRQDVYRKLYPEVANDPMGDSLRAQFADVLARKDLPNSSAEQIAGLRSSWELEFDAWRSKAEASLLDWSDREVALERGYVGESAKSNINGLLQKRDEIHRNWQAILEDQIPDPATAAQSH
jgi:hypothetical protein